MCWNRKCCGITPQRTLFIDNGRLTACVSRDVCNKHGQSRYMTLNRASCSWIGYLLLSHSVQIVYLFIWLFPTSTVCVFIACHCICRTWMWISAPSSYPRRWRLSRDRTRRCSPCSHSWKTFCPRPDVRSTPSFRSWRCFTEMLWWASRYIYSAVLLYLCACWVK